MRFRRRRRTADEVVGLMMIKDEEDVLEEALGNHVRFVDRIYVLDGTRSAARLESRDICASFPQVAEHWFDGDTDLPSPLRDGARQFLLDRARHSHKPGTWYVILHGDEIWAQDPRPHLERGPAGEMALAVRLYHFFPHTSEADTWQFGPRTCIENLSRWYMRPGVVEHRAFLDDGVTDYDSSSHSRVVPAGLAVHPTELVVKQYNYRSAEQAFLRAESRKASEWQENHYQHLLGPDAAFFVDTLDHPVNRWAAMYAPGEGIATNIGLDPLPIWR